MSLAPAASPCSALPSRPPLTDSLCGRPLLCFLTLPGPCGRQRAEVVAKVLEPPAPAAPPPGPGAQPQTHTLVGFALLWCPFVIRLLFVAAALLFGFLCRVKGGRGPSAQLQEAGGGQVGAQLGPTHSAPPSLRQSPAPCQASGGQEAGSNSPLVGTKLGVTPTLSPQAGRGRRGVRPGGGWSRRGSAWKTPGKLAAWPREGRGGPSRPGWQAGAREGTAGREGDGGQPSQGPGGVTGRPSLSENSDKDGKAGGTWGQQGQRHPAGVTRGSSRAWTRDQGPGDSLLSYSGIT